MREQQSGLGKPVPSRQQLAAAQRQAAIEARTRQQAHPHRVGHHAGLHPEDRPFLTDEDEVYDDVWPSRLPTSARRYNTTADGHVIRQGNTTFVVHDEYPPVRQPLLPTPRHSDEEIAAPKPPRRVHWLVWVGVALFVMIIGWIAFSSLGAWLQVKQDDWTYGQSPRHFTIDAVVGHSDSSSNPSHFIAENNKGDVFVIELPGGDSSKAHIYQITTITGNEGNPPVRVSFQDISRDGKLDMLIQIGDPGSVVTIILFNNGSQFVSKL